jgi:hypothetical protein
MIIPLISLIWLAMLAVLVAWLASHPHRATSTAAQRSPSLLESTRRSFEQAMSEVLRATPAATSSKPAATEHVRDGAQENLYVRP